MWADITWIYVCTYGGIDGRKMKWKGENKSTIERNLFL